MRENAKGGSEFSPGVMRRQRDGRRGSAAERCRLCSHRYHARTVARQGRDEPGNAGWLLRRTHLWPGTGPTERVSARDQGQATAPVARDFGTRPKCTSSSSCCAPSCSSTLPRRCWVPISGCGASLGLWGFSKLSTAHFNRVVSGLLLVSGVACCSRSFDERRRGSGHCA
jgi:hypothetical protein